MFTLAINSFLADGATFKLDTGTWIALVLAALATMYVMTRAKKRREDPLERSTITTSLSQQRQVERQMSNLLVELSEMSRSISANLDTRAARLEALIDNADRKIAELKALSNGRSETSVPSHYVSIPSAPPSTTNDESPRLDYDAPLAKTSPEAPVNDAMMDDQDARHAQIYSLADQGRSAHEIAATLSRPSGEVELILALRPGRS